MQQNSNDMQQNISIQSGVAFELSQNRKTCNRNDKCLTIQECAAFFFFLAFLRFLFLSQSAEDYICLEEIKTVAVIHREIQTCYLASLPKLNFPQQIVKSDALLREKQFSKVFILLCSTVHEEWGMANLVRVYYNMFQIESICPFERRET